MNLIQVQEEYIRAVNAGYRRWSHRPDGGHARRIRRGAWRRATRRLGRLGYTQWQIPQLIRDAEDIAQLERLSEE